ncbi:MAG: glycosyltransferase [Candidatus Nanoarchaeia archaeon]|nr:glycosyltransferase [Candidatus Nanoarchaeia archaeon]MDD5053853.1 glycosyltransferase [Candidatus Nanoarchaeia archaeon]
MKISIIIISKEYNGGLNNTIKTWKNQSYKNKELIVVTPETKKIKSKNLILIKDPKRGPSHARNLGIKKASGKFIMLRDSDEFSSYKKDKNIISDIMDEIIKKNADAANISFHYPSKKKSFLRTIINIKDTPHSNDVFWPIIFEKKIMASGFDENLEYGEDADFYSRLEKNSKNPITIEREMFNDSSIDNFSLFFKRYRWYGNTIKKYIKKTKDFKPAYLMLLSIAFVLSIFLSFYSPIFMIYGLVYLFCFYFKKINFMKYFLKKNMLLEFLCYPFIDVFSKLIMLFYFIKSFFS